MNAKYNTLRNLSIDMPWLIKTSPTRWKSCINTIYNTLRNLSVCGRWLINTSLARWNSCIHRHILLLTLGPGVSSYAVNVNWVRPFHLYWHFPTQRIRKSCRPIFRNKAVALHFELEAKFESLNASRFCTHLTPHNTIPNIGQTKYRQPHHHTSWVPEVYSLDLLARAAAHTTAYLTDLAAASHRQSIPIWCGTKWLLTQIRATID